MPRQRTACTKSATTSPYSRPMPIIAKSSDDSAKTRYVVTDDNSVWIFADNELIEPPPGQTPVCVHQIYGFWICDDKIYSDSHKNGFPNNADGVCSLLAIIKRHREHMSALSKVEEFLYTELAGANAMFFPSATDVWVDGEECSSSETGIAALTKRLAAPYKLVFETEEFRTLGNLEFKTSTVIGLIQKLQDWFQQPISTADKDQWPAFSLYKIGEPRHYPLRHRFLERIRIDHVKRVVRLSLGS